MVLEQIKKPFRITYLLLALNILIFVAVWLKDPSLDTVTLVKYGAKISYKVVDGEWFRLVSCMFLHGGWTHLIFNMLALYQLGVETELIFGKIKFLIIYFISGIVGSLASVLVSPGVAVGASGAIFGLMGANIYLYTLNPVAYKRVFGTQIIGVLVINFVYGFVAPNIAMSAHIGGLIGGFVAAWAVGYRNQTQMGWKNNLARVALVVLIPTSLYVSTILIHNSSDYYLYKGVFAIQEGNINLAETTFKEGLLSYPNNADFKTSLEQIKAYKEQLNLK